MFTFYLYEEGIYTKVRTITRTQRFYLFLLETLHLCTRSVVSLSYPNLMKLRHNASKNNKQRLNLDSSLLSTVMPFYNQETRKI